MQEHLFLFLIAWSSNLQRYACCCNIQTSKFFCCQSKDCWPGNFMWMIQQKEEESYLKLLDWEMVGLGSGPQDLGQYVLSNMDPAERRESEEELVKAYFEELKRCGVSNVDWEYCWNEYKFGGLERWLWFMIYFAGQPPESLPGWAQFFHNQISAFMKDHQITADDVGQPRP